MPTPAVKAGRCYLSLDPAMIGGSRLRFPADLPTVPGMLLASLVLIGVMLAATLLLVVAMCVSAARGDREMERMIADALQPGAEVIRFAPKRAAGDGEGDAASA